MIPSQVMLLLRKHKYLENDFIYSLQISDCKYQYEIFEKVFTTIADKHKIFWKDIYKANIRNNENYLLLCISSILIDKLLRIEFHLAISSREKLLGVRLNEIVRDYYKYL